MCLVTKSRLSHVTKSLHTTWLDHGYTIHSTKRVMITIGLIAVCHAVVYVSTS